MTLTCLSNLPSEILLEIFERLDDLALHRLAQTDQKLRQVIKAIVTGEHLSYLQTLVDAESLSLDGHTVQDLLQNNLAFTPEIRLILHHTPQLFKNLEALRTLLLRLDRVCLDLRLSPREYSEPSIILSPRWSNLLTEVMNIVVAMSHSQLTVGRGRNWGTLGRPFHYEYVEPFLLSHSRFPDENLANPAHSRRKALFTSFMRPIRRLIEGIVAKLKPRGAQPSLSETATNLLERSTKSCDVTLSSASASHLNEFHIHSLVLMELPFFHWTMATLATSPIMRLSFSDISLTHYDWEYILSILSIPTLSHISFGSANIAFPDLQMFLSRHSSITTLDLSRSTAIGYLKPFSQKLLPNLDHLIANSGYLAHFLEPPSAFPNLRSITMATGYIGGFRILDYEMRRFNTVLRRIAARGRNVALNLCFVSDTGIYGLNTWLRSIHMRVGMEVLVQVPNVVKLEVFVNISPDPDTLVDLLKFFPMFPSLKHLTSLDRFGMPDLISTQCDGQFGCRYLDWRPSTSKKGQWKLRRPKVDIETHQDTPFGGRN